MSDDRAPQGLVTLGIAAGDPKPHFVRTVLDVVVYDREYGGKHLNPTRPAIWVVGASFVTNARNELVRNFLAMDDPASEWLLLLDDDQLYPANLLDALIAVADPEQRRIIGLPVWRFASEDDGMVRVTHNVFDITAESFFIERVEPLPENSLIQVAGIGTGCMLIHRSALVEIAEFGEKNGFGRNHVWFQQRVHPADFAEGEDLHFCRLAGAAQIPVFCLTSHVLEHVKEVRLTKPLPFGAVSI